MSRPIQDPEIMNKIKKSVRYDYEHSDLKVIEIAAKHKVSVRSVYVWSEGLKRKAINESRYTTILLTKREADILLLSVQELTKISKGDLLRRLNIMEDRLCGICETLEKREAKS